MPAYKIAARFYLTRLGRPKMEMPKQLEMQSIIFFRDCQTFFAWARRDQKIPKIGFQKLFDRDMDKVSICKWQDKGLRPNWSTGAMEW
jgi:hypothetical protein